MSSFDPWSIDYFNPPTPHRAPPSPKTRTPKPVPDPEKLFTVQRHALQIMNEIENLGEVKDKRALERLRQAAERNYRVIRSYLAENVAPAQGDFSA
jgi:hypothetical protein